MSDRRSSICLFGAGGYGRVVAAQMRAVGFQSLLFGHDTAQPGAVINPGLSIAPCITVGAGAVVTNSIATAGTYVGVPARLHQER